jgi:geranylgeranyl pyrophosphate synthase
VTPRQHPITWQKEQADFVNNEIEVLLASLSGTASFSDIIREPLAGFRQRIVDEAARYKPWYLLPLIVCEAISGHYKRAIPASAAIQLFMAAGEVFDDIEDADAAGSLSAKYGTAIATNAATTLLILAERAITRLKGRGVVDCVIVRIMDAVNSFYTNACAGQHLDLNLTSKTTISEDTYLRVASMKSATTIECACHFGAVLATVNQELIDSFTLFGHNLGMASQIANDIRGVNSGSDIIGHKITLPVVYALAHAESKVHSRLELALSDACEIPPDSKQTKDLLFESGAILYATIKMEIYKQNALDILDGLEKAGANVERLKSFLE